MSKKIRKTNPQLIQLIEDLKIASHNNDARIWRDIAKRLERPLRNWAEVNLSRIERYVNNGETIVVPGKVLGAGELSKKVTIAAYSISNSAKEKLEKSGSKVLSIRELIEQNPKGSNVRIIG